MVSTFLAADLELSRQLWGHHARPDLPGIPDRGLLQAAQLDQRYQRGVHLLRSGRHRLVGKSGRMDIRKPVQYFRAAAELRRDLLRLGHGWLWPGLSRGWGYGHGYKHGGERHNSGHHDRRD